MSKTNNNIDSRNSYHLKLVERVNAGDADSVKELLSSSIEYSQSINNTDANGCTPLFYAAWMGREDLCKELLKHGADIFKEVKSFRPIHVAASKNHANVVKLLLSKGDTFYQSDINRIQSSKKMRMKLSQEIIALAKNDVDGTTTFSINHAHAAPAASEFNNSIDISSNYEKRLERFMLAVSQGDMHRIKKYLAKKVVKINDVIQHDTSSEFFNMTALHVASKYNQHAAVVFLVKLGGQYMRKPVNESDESSSPKKPVAKKQLSHNKNVQPSSRSDKTKSQQAAFYVDLSKSIKKIIQACDNSATNSNEWENCESLNCQQRKSDCQFNGYVQQLHTQVDQSLNSLFPFEN